MGTKISEIADQIDSSNLQDAKFVVEDNLTTKYVTGSQLQSFIGAGGPHLYPMYRYKYEPDMSVATLNQFSTWLKANWENHGQQAPPGIYTWKFDRNHYGQGSSGDAHLTSDHNHSDEGNNDITIDVTTQFPTEPIIKETGNEASGGLNVKGRGTLKYGLAYYQGKLFILVGTSQGKGIEYDGNGPRWLTYLPADTNPNPGIGGIDITARVAINGNTMVDKPTNFNVTAVSTSTSSSKAASGRNHYKHYHISFGTPLTNVSFLVVRGTYEDGAWFGQLENNGMQARITGRGSKSGGTQASYPSFGEGTEIIFIK